MEGNQPQVLFFDVNETLLDIRPLKASVGRALDGRDDLAALWFSTMLHYSLVATVADRYRDFLDIGVAALRMVAAKQAIALTEQDAYRTIESIQSLPAHPDVLPALTRLKAAGYRMYALSNSSSDGLAAQLRNTGLDAMFDELLSVETIGIYKPHGHVYRWAAGRATANVKDCMMIAAHGWDVAGAIWVGMQAAFVARPTQQLYPHAPSPTIVEPNLERIADKLLPR
ncbi:MAG: haloacid dehalogenase type II [bacterium]|nr:haloacid dehalogenase type II [bacterium]